MKKHRLITIVLLLVACLLAACGQNSQAPISLLEEKPLLTDADFDKAQLQLGGEVKELVGIEEGMALAGQDLPALADVTSELSAQAVLPNVSGAVYYLSSQFVLSSQCPNNKLYKVYRHDQHTDKVAKLLETCREIQSVAGGLDNIDGQNNSVVISMHQWVTPPSGVKNDFEIFLITFSDVGTPGIFQLTSDDVDNIHVSITANRSRIVYEEPFNSKATVIIRKLQGLPASYNKLILGNTFPQAQPALSTDGQFLVLLRKPVGGSQSIQRYTLATNSYLTVAGGVDITNDFEYPSVSADGQKVLFLNRNGATQSQLIRLKNLTTGITQTVASGVSIRHPFLAADGRFMAYEESSKIKTKDLLTGQVQALTNGLGLIFYGSPMWQQKVPGPVLMGTLRVNISGLPSVQNRVSVTGPNFNSGQFGSSRTFSNLVAGTYTITAQGVTVGTSGKPGCQIFRPDFPSQGIIVTAGQTATATITYTGEPCSVTP